MMGASPAISQNTRCTMPRYMKDVKARVKHCHTMFVQCKRKRPIVFLEGPSDSDFYDRLVSNDAIFQVMGDKTNVLLTVDECKKFLKERNNTEQFAFGIVDLDYDRLLGETESDPTWVLCVDQYADIGASRDTEIMLFRSDALDNVLLKYRITTSPDTLRTSLLDAGALVGAGYLLESQMYIEDGREIGTYQKLDYSKFFDPSLAMVDLDAFIMYKFDDVCETHKSLDNIRERIYEIYNRYEPSELARGHDVTKMLALYLCNCKQVDYITHIDVERELRLNIDLNTFWSGNFGVSLRKFVERTSK